MKRLRIFVVGPDLPLRYRAVREFVQRTLGNHASRGSFEFSILSPDRNPNTDRLNDWIFGQIDTCDLLIADVTNFNANVIYEVAFAHTLGTPCIYLRFPDNTADDDETRFILHYFRTSLLIDTSESELAADRCDPFAERLNRFLDGKPPTGETILSDYYGAFPSDAEFMRGLAEGYFRNFLGRILIAEPPDEYKNCPLVVAIPDTFETTDRHLRDVLSEHLAGRPVAFASNAVGRPLPASYNEERGIFIDVPTTILTVTLSSKYKKISKDKGYFTDADRDKLTDLLARKFVAALWDKVREKREEVGSLARRLEFVWLSNLVGAWHPDPTLMNSTPFDRPTIA